MQHQRTGYFETLDYTQLPGFGDLSTDQQQRIREAFTTAYESSVGSMGMKVAVGKAFETARLALVEAMKPVPSQPPSVPRSIFAGLDNCE